MIDLSHVEPDVQIQGMLFTLIDCTPDKMAEFDQQFERADEDWLQKSYFEKYAVYLSIILRPHDNDPEADVSKIDVNKLGARFVETLMKAFLPDGRRIWMPQIGSFVS